MQQQQQQPYQQHEMQDMYYQHQVQQYPYQQLYQQPDQQPYPQHPYPNQQQLYQHQQQQQQQQQPIVPSQPAINWVYTDLPVQRLETLGTLQVVIGTILIVLIMLFVSQYNNIGYFWSVLVLGSGVAALVALKRKDKLMVIVSGVLAVCAAIITALIIIFTIIVIVNYCSSLFNVSKSTSDPSSGSTGSSSSSGSNSNSEDNTSFHVGHFLVLIIFIVVVAIQFCELTISTKLAVLTRQIVQTMHAVPPSCAAPILLLWQHTNKRE